MAKALPLLCLLAILSLSSFSANAATADFSYLTLSWPGSYCNGKLHKKCCAPLSDGFPDPAADFHVAEGLETYNSATGKPVTSCAKPCQFFLNWLRPFLDDMFTYWPDLSCPSNNGEKHWNSAWCKYGTCSNLTQPDYFNRTLTLRSKINLLSVFRANGIRPSKVKTYKLEDIEAALISKFGFSTVVECDKKPARRPFAGESPLSKVRFCVSLDGKSLIGCPISKSSNCGENVKFYPFDSEMITCEDKDDVFAGMNFDPLEMPHAKDAAK